MHRLWLIVVALAALFASTAFAQPPDCPSSVDAALTASAQACANLGRNTVCYGNALLDAQGRTPDFTFARVGDIADVTALQALRLTPLDTAANTWGIAVLNLQASLPDTVPGQNVTLVLLGDVGIENVVSAERLTVTATSSARLRSEPVAAGDTNVVSVAPSGTALEAHGRNAAGDWLRVTYNDPQQGVVIAWVSTQVLSGAADRMRLPEIGANDPLYTPMQAFTLKTGIGDRACAQAPDSGLLVQTPQGAASVRFTVNGVEVTLGSTAWLQTDSATLRVAVVEGTGYVSADGTTQITPAGTFVSVPLSADGASPAGPPSTPQPYDAAELAALPIGIIGTSNVSLLPEPVAVATPLEADAIDAAIATIQADIVPARGSWQQTLTSIVTIEDTLQTQQGVAGCYLNAQEGMSVTIEAGRFADFFDLALFENIGVGSYRRSNTIDANNEYVSTLIVHSPTEVTRIERYRNEWTGGGTGENYRIVCEQTWRAVWLGE